MAENTAAVETTEAKPEVVCPHCGGKDLIYVEDYPVYWKITEIKDGKILMSGSATTDFDVGGSNTRLQCESCGELGPVPEGLEPEWY